MAAVYNVYYHDDLDGHCAGAVFKYLHSSADASFNMHAIQYNYNFDSVFGQLISSDSQEDKNVVFLDFCPARNDLDALLNAGVKVTVVDHHVSKNWILEYKDKMPVYFDDSGTTSGCMLAWTSFAKDGQPVPPSVYATAMWDTWQHDKDPRIVPWHDGCELLITDPATEDGYAFWENTFENSVDMPENMTDEQRAARMQWDTVMQVINMGTIIGMYKSCRADSLTNSLHDMIISGKKFLMLNSKLSNSYEFPAVIDDSYFGHGWYWWTGKEWIFSLRSEGKNDLTSIPGVEGHKNAAGFHVHNFQDAKNYLRCAGENS